MTTADFHDASTMIDMNGATARELVFMNSAFADERTEQVFAAGGSSTAIAAHVDADVDPRSFGLVIFRFSDTNYARDLAREKRLGDFKNQSLRALAAIRRGAPARFVRISALASTLRFSCEHESRDALLEEHEQLWQRRVNETDATLWDAQEDNLLALALLATEREAEETERARKTAAQLVVSPVAASREASLQMELRLVLGTVASRDLKFLRREMTRALARGEQSIALLCALAAHVYPHKPLRARDDDATCFVACADAALRTELSGRDVDRLAAELDEIRVAQALGRIDARLAARGERIADLLASH